MQPKNFRNKSVHWFERSPGDANATEELFFASLVLQYASLTVEKLNEWASEVLVHETAYRQQGAAWTPPAEWKPARGRDHPLVKVLVDAYMCDRKTEDKLDQIGTAIQAWPCTEPGQFDDLTEDKLRQHFSWAGNAKVAKAGHAKARLRRALIPVAALVKRKGVELRKLLRLDAAASPPPTREQQHAALVRRADLAELCTATEVKRRKVADNKVSQYGKRLKLKSKAATDARRAEHKKMAKLSAKQKKEVMARARAARAKVQEAMRKKAEEAAAKASEAETKKLRERLKRARARARAVESAAKENQRNLKRAKVAEAALAEAVKELQETLEEEPEEEEDSDEEDAAAVESSRRDARGRWKAMPQKLRVLIWAELARRVAPSAVASNIFDAITAYAPDAELQVPCQRVVAQMRGELTVASEAIAAFRVALCKRIISFGWDESTKFGLGLLSSNTQIETQTGEVVDVIMRGATLTAGGTAEAIAWSIDRKIFTHARELLVGWKAAHEKQYGAGSWAAAGGPDPESIGIHRLSEESLLMSDTCNAARACKQLVAEAARKAGREKIGDDAWEALTEEQQAAKCRVYIGQCHQHLRNIIINAMQLKATESLKEKLRDSLAEFTSFDRMSVDVNDLIRAIYKELHGGGAYAKGKGREFTGWVKKHFPAAIWMPLERAEGGRQDLVFDGSVPIFIMRPIVLEFLRGLMVPGADNQLEKFLLRVLGCNEVTAALRVNTLWHYTFSRPARFLAGSSRKLREWSIDSSSRMMDLVEKAMVEVAADGRRLLDPNFDPFAAIAAEQPVFCAWREKMTTQTVKSFDGTPHRVNELALAEARDSKGAGNAQATDEVVRLAEEMANAALVAMRDPKRAICSLLTSQDGDHAAGKDPTVHAATVGANVTNDRVESNFGCVDMLMRMYRYATVENISGMAQQMHNGDFERPLPVDEGRGRKRKAAEEGAASTSGFFHGLTAELQWSLVEFTRREAVDARRDGRAALQEQDAERLSRREERVITMLNRAVEHYAYAKELFESWQTQRAKSAADIEQALTDPPKKAGGKRVPKPEAQQLEYLRTQIEMRVLGCGWTQYQTRWSSSKDSRVGTVAHLQGLLEEIVDEERTRQRFTPGTVKGLPAEAAPPHHQSADLGQLGTADADAVEITKRTLFSAEDLEAKAAAAMRRRQETGVADSVERQQPQEAPAFDQQLVGKRLEVLWKYFNKETNEAQMIWSTGTVKRVADGLTDKRSSRAKKVLPAGAVLWAWDADPEFDEQAGEQWLFLLPKKWNPTTHSQVYSWRYDPRELGAARAPKPDANRKNAKRVRESADELL